MDGLSGIGWSLISFAILIGFGITFLAKFGDIAGGSANTTIQYIITQLGQSGLAGWIPMIILLFIMGLVFVYFGKGGGKTY